MRHLLILLIALATNIVSVAGVRVAFRLDDIQDYYVTEGQFAVMDIFKANNTPLTIGIIGGPSKFGSDGRIVNYVRSAVSNPNWEVEVANHGNLHESFGIPNAATQHALINEALNNTYRILGFPSLQIKTFIPPFNEFNNFTIPVLQSLGFTYFSSQIQLDTVRPYPLSGQSFYRFPIGAATNDLNINAYFQGVSANKTFADIQAQIAIDGFACVMMHPYEFMVRIGNTAEYQNTVVPAQLNELRRLLQLVKTAGYEIVPIGRLNSDSPPNTLTGASTTSGPIFPSSNTVAFRLAGLEDYYQTSAGFAIMEIFRTLNLPLTVGVIAGSFGTDPSLVNYLKNNGSLLEIANYGYNFEDYGNASYSYNFQLTRIANSSQVIKNVLNRTATTFLPPTELFNANTITALKNLGFNTLCTMRIFDLPPYNKDPVNNLWRFPYAVMADYSASDTYNRSLEGIAYQVQTDGFAVVSIAPEWYYNGNTLVTARINQLRNLVQGVVAAGYRVVTVGRLSQLYSSTTGGSVPPTTAVPTTAVASTAVRTTAVPTTAVASTAVASTAIPTTAIPTTAVRTTAIPTTAVASTAVASTAMPTTAVASTAVGTTSVGTTAVPTTAATTRNTVATTAQQAGTTASTTGNTVATTAQQAGTASVGTTGATTASQTTGDLVSLGSRISSTLCVVIVSVVLVLLVH